jgi:hypothetical protein
MVPAEYEMFEQVVTVGCVNFSPIWGDKKRALAKIEANVVESAAQGISHRDKDCQRCSFSKLSVALTSSSPSPASA